jgi:hypothetical protein
VDLTACATSFEILAPRRQSRCACQSVCRVRGTCSMFVGSWQSTSRLGHGERRIASRRAVRGPIVPSLPVASFEAQAARLRRCQPGGSTAPLEKRMSAPRGASVDVLRGAGYRAWGASCGSGGTRRFSPFGERHPALPSLVLPRSSYQMQSDVVRHIPCPSRIDEEVRADGRRTHTVGASCG